MHTFSPQGKPFFPQFAVAPHMDGTSLHKSRFGLEGKRKSQVGASHV